jgi:hypothetical protein
MADYINGLNINDLQKLSPEKMSIDMVTEYTKGLDKDITQDLITRISKNEWKNYTCNNPNVFEDIIAHFYTSINCDNVCMYRTMNVYQYMLINFILHHIPGRVAYIEYCLNHYLVRIDNTYTQVVLY